MENHNPLFAVQKAAPKGVAVLAREALVAMAKENVTPTPANYKRYYESISGGKAPDDTGTTVLQRLLDSLKAQGSPLVGEWETAIGVALARRDGRMIEKLILKSIHPVRAEIVKAAEPDTFPDKCKTCAEVRSLNGILYVIESFARNLEGLFPENPMLMGQVEIVKDLLECPKDMKKMYSAKRALAKMATPEQTQLQLSEAKSSAKNLADAFLAQIGQTGNDAGDFLKEVEAGKQAMENAKDKASLLTASLELLAGAAAVHGKMKENQTRLENSKTQAQSAADRIQALEEEVALVSQQAQQDYLTGLLNRRGMDEQIAKLFGNSIQKVTLALLDIDNFNKLKDKFGREAGDAALRHLSDAIRESVKDKGIPARLGGEEFAVVFAGCDAQQVKEEMEKLQRLLTRKIFMSNAEKRVVTFSAGVAQRAKNEAPTETLARADEAMFAAKKKGKNRVEISELH
ncbi:MAG: diguanylate cyclase [Sulfuricellaceae bacterium]